MGDYYWFNVKCIDVIFDQCGWCIEMIGLFKSFYFWIVSVGDIEFYMQGFSFYVIECDEVGFVCISFVLICLGIYDFEIGSVLFFFVVFGEEWFDWKFVIVKIVVK